ncbi:MAG: hypothetical protein ACQR33_04505 [Candidatus Saccharibacteria bacterium]
MSLSSEGVTYAWLQGRNIDPLFGDSHENGFGGSAHPDTVEGLDEHELTVSDTYGEIEMQYAMALGYNEESVYPTAVLNAEALSSRFCEYAGRAITTIVVTHEALIGGDDQITVGPWQRSNYDDAYGEAA